VVLGLGEHDFVSLAQELPAPGVGDEVYGLGRAAGEDETPDVRRAEETGHLLACLLVGCRGFFGEAVDAAVDVGVVFFVVFSERLDHPPRLLGGRGVIQIDELFPVDPPVEDREVVPDLLYVVHL
jgi:hypothetical protein